MIEIKHRETGEVLYHTDAASLHGADLTDQGFKGADLRGTDLRQARLSGASFDGADLRGAQLDQAHLHNAFLIGADLRGASLRFACVGFAKLEGADLRTADFEGADLVYADLTNADLRWANLQDAKLNEASLEGAQITGANFQGATLRGVRFSDLQALWQAHELGAQLTIHNLKNQIYWDGYRLPADAPSTAPAEDPAREQEMIKRLDQMRDWTVSTKIRGSHHDIAWAEPGMLKIGCLTLPICEWLERYEELGRENDYSPRAIREYKGYLEFLALQMAKEIWPDIDANHERNESHDPR